MALLPAVSQWTGSGIDKVRQKLQRRIANARGVAPDVALASPTRASVEDPRVGADVQKPEAPALPSTDSRENSNGVVQKRKYRRHPKVRCAT